MFLVQSTSVKTIDHKFFQPGHSYMECDRAFGLIEKQKKRSINVFIPDHWTDVIRKTSKNFNIINMTPADFVSFDYLDSIIMDPKKQEDKKISLKWHDMVWFRYRKEDFFSFSFKHSRHADWPFTQTQKCSTLQKGRPNLKISALNKNLYGGSLPITDIKWNNLNELLPFVPPIYHEYYRTLPHANKETIKKLKDPPKKSKQAETDDTVTPDGDIDFDTSRVELESDYDE